MTATLDAEMADLRQANAELQQRFHEAIAERDEAVQRETATGEILQLINSSPGNLTSIFNAMLEKALRLCGANFGVMNTFDGEHFHHAADCGVPAAYARYRRQRGPTVYGSGTAPSRLVAGENLIHTTDLMTTDSYQRGDPNRRALVDVGGARSHLTAALRKGDTLLGDIAICRQDVLPFSDKQITLLQNFAAQAVIAMENARLLGELQQRTNDLQESLEYQIATSDVLKVMSGSVFDLEPVLQTVVTVAVRLCRADQAVIYRNVDGEYRWAAGHSLTPEYERIEREVRIRPGTGTLVGRAALEARTIHVHDALADPLYEAKADARVGGVRTMLGVPLLRDGVPIGVIGLARRRIEAYSDNEIELVRTFADQAVIAIENARLLSELRQARDAAEGAYRDLKAAQANLIQAEKMASLGQLTAGIAHEIKNPLNFVNNFASLSVELLDELKETTAPAISFLAEEKRAEVDETIETLTSNLEKIAVHGRRADGIVKSMLEHSRGVTGERRSVDLNGLIDEALNLAYHGARAQDPNFNITLERDFAPGMASIEIVPQDITRVCLNLFSNGFYAANKHRRETAFEPVLKVTTRDLGDAVEVRVHDNGIGIPAEIKDKLFQPFFTTKPTGEGTGLGLSISYDIVSQEHGGSIKVDSRVGEFTEFTMRLPRSFQTTSGGTGA